MNSVDGAATLGATIGAMLPLAVGIAISPVPIIAAILMLLSPRARATSVAFLAGWVAGVAITVAVFALLGGLMERDEGGSPSLFGAILQLVLGAAALVLAAQQWRSRPKEGEDPTLPGWMSAIDSMSGGKAFGLAFLLGSVNPKNLLLAVAAGFALGEAAGLGAQIVAFLVYVVIASATVALPVLAFLVAPERITPALTRLRVWLVANNATVMTVLFVVLGANLIGKGLGAF